MIAQSVDEAGGGKARGGDAGREPGLVHLGEEAGDLTPTGAFAAFAGVAYEHDEEIEAVAGGVDHAVGAGADHVAESSQKLKKNGGGVGFGMGSDGADGKSRETVERSFAQCWIFVRARRRRAW